MCVLGVFCKCSGGLFGGLWGVFEGLFWCELGCFGDVFLGAALLWSAHVVSWCVLVVVRCYALCVCDVFCFVFWLGSCFCLGVVVL